MSSAAPLLRAGRPADALTRIASQLRAREPVLARFGLALLALMSVAALGLALDPRTLNGVSVWVKPMKFMLSTAVYAWTLAWFFGYLSAAERRRRAGRFVIRATVIAGSLEIAYITWQAARGLPSHFYQPTPLYAVLYTLMGTGALILVSAALVQAWRIARAGLPQVPVALKTAVVCGLVLSFALGGGAGIYLSLQESHWVGGTLSDAAGLPGFGWSRDGGDLRVAHFFGLHAMQLIPLFGWLVQRRRPRQARAAVLAFTGAYALFTVAVFVQALRGQPFL